MALFRPIHGEMSGSIGNSVFAHGKSGSIVRRRAIPTNPTSVQQQAIRSSLQRRVDNWITLGDSTRALWREYALTLARANRLGDSIALSGQQAFLLNTVRLWYLTQTTASSPPTVPPPDPATTIAVAAASGTQLITLTFTPTPLGANLRMVVWATPPALGGRNDNFRRARVQGATAANPASGVTLTSRWRLSAGLSQNYYLCSMFQDGQISGYQRVRVTIT